MRDMTPDPYPPFSGVEPYGTVRSIADERAHRKRICALGYRIFGAMRWGLLGDGHISARDPVFTDHFWLLDWGVPFSEATVRRLVLVGPGGEVKNADGIATGAVNTAGYNIHHPLLAARPDVVSASHTHTAFGTPWSANVEPFRALSQEACAFVFDQALFNDEEVEVLSIDGGRRIAAALGNKKFCILRNHGLLTVGPTIADAFLSMYTLQRACEIQVAAQGAGAELIPVPQSIIDSAEVFRKVGTRGLGGQLVWPGLLRKLDRIDTSYAS